MGKINKHANIYDTNGNLLRHVDDNGNLQNYSIPELEELVDKLANDKDENGHVKDPQALNNVNMILFQQYQKYGNPHKTELINKLKDLQKAKEAGEVTMVGKTTEEEVKEALNDLIEPELPPTFNEESLTDKDTNYQPDTYIDFEEIKEAA